MKHLGVVLALLFVMTCRAKPPAGLAIYVDDSSSDLVIMGNPAFYEVAFRSPTDPSLMSSTSPLASGLPWGPAMRVCGEHAIRAVCPTM